MSYRADPPRPVLPPLSPISSSRTDDWSPIHNYQFSGNGRSRQGSIAEQGKFGPKASIPHPIDTPPLSVHSSANSSHGRDGPRPRPNGNPSPPSSVDRTSIITTATIDEKRYQEMETTLVVHHRALVRFLAPYMRELRSDPKQNRATDKLQRLSMSQFQELSTDVYDELTRRDEERRRGGPNPGNPTPRYLLPRPNFHEKRNQARQKLSTLPPERFQQLATDVFFELERRFPRFARNAGQPPPINNSPVPPREAPPRNGNNAFPPRSQSRGDLRSPPTQAPQAFPPRDDSNNLGKPLPKMFQSNVMVPDKGRMIEDDDDLASVRSMNRSPPDATIIQYKNDLQSLERKVDDLVLQLQRKDRQLDEAIKSPKIEMDAQRSEFDGLRSGLERKLRDAQSLNDSLQAEIARVRSEKSELERDQSRNPDLQTQLDDERRRNQSNEDEWRRRLDDNRREARDAEDRLRRQLDDLRDQARGGFDDSSEWKQKYELVNRELQRQQQVTDEVRREASRFLQEMREISQQSSESLEKEERLQDQVRLLQQEAKMWKAKYTRVAGATGDDRVPPITGSVLSDVSQYVRDGAYVASSGVVKDTNITDFQLAMDDLLAQVRTGNDRNINDSIKMIVMAVRLITIDIETYESRNGFNGGEPSKLQTRLSQAANNLITATKTFTESNGLGPITSVDTAASYLFGAVVDIIKSFKIRRSSPEELIEDSPAPSPDYMYSARPAPLNTKNKGSISDSSMNSAIMRNASSSSNAYSTYRYSGGYSSNTSPQILNITPYVGGQVKGPIRDQGIIEFRNVVEEYNTSFTRNIQALVNIVRSQPNVLADDPVVNTYVNDISSSALELVNKANMTIREVNNAALSKQAPPVVDLLEFTARDLLSAKERGEINVIPQVAFKINRTAKALLTRVRGIESGEITKDTSAAIDVL